MIISSIYPLTFLYTDPYTDAFWNWMSDNYATDFNGWDALTGTQKSNYAVSYETATSTTSVRTVMVELSRNGGSSYSTIATGISLSKDPTVNTIYYWTVTGPTTSNARFRITDSTDATIVQTTGDLVITALAVVDYTGANNMTPVNNPTYAESTLKTSRRLSNG